MRYFLANNRLSKNKAKSQFLSIKPGQNFRFSTSSVNYSLPPPPPAPLWTAGIHEVTSSQTLFLCFGFACIEVKRWVCGHQLVLGPDISDLLPGISTMFSFYHLNNFDFKIREFRAVQTESHLKTQ